LLNNNRKFTHKQLTVLCVLILKNNHKYNSEKAEYSDKKPQDQRERGMQKTNITLDSTKPINNDLAIIRDIYSY